MKSNPDITLIYPESFPDELIREEKSFFDLDSINLQIVKENPRPFAALEWIVPTACILYVFKSYFNGFLTEAGKDHYHILKKGIQNSTKKAKLIDAKLISSSATPNKLSNKYNQSGIVSLILETKDNRQLKLLFDNDLSYTDWENGIEELLELVIENHNLFPEDKLSSKISELEMYNSRELYAIINPKSKNIEICDTNALMKKYK